jgi:transposase
MKQNKPIELRPYSLKELSGMYNVSKNTFKKWLSEFSEDLGERKGYYYSVIQVKLIFEKLGLPS